MASFFNVVAMPDHRERERQQLPDRMRALLRADTQASSGLDEHQPPEPVLRGEPKGADSGKRSVLQGERDIRVCTK